MTARGGVPIGKLSDRATRQSGTDRIGTICPRSFQNNYRRVYNRDSSGSGGVEVEGASPGYTPWGDELYVRAIMTSSAMAAVPSGELKFKRAWTQPAGW